MRNRMFQFVFALVFMAPILASAAEKTYLVDLLGNSTGFIEQLYSKKGLQNLAFQIKQSLKNEDDSVYLFFETISYTKAVIIKASLKNNEIEWTSARAEKEKTSRICTTEKMKTFSLYDREYFCYRNKDEFYLHDHGTLGWNIKTMEDHLIAAKDYAEDQFFVDFKEMINFAETSPDISNEYASLSKHYLDHDFKGRNLAWILIVEAGWSWHKNPVNLLDYQEGFFRGKSTAVDNDYFLMSRMASAIRQLRKDNKTFLEVNAASIAKADQIPGHYSNSGAIIDTPATRINLDRPVAGVGSSLQDLFTVMEEVGYKYHAETNTWSK